MYCCSTTIHVDIMANMKGGFYFLLLYIHGSQVTGSSKSRVNRVNREESDWASIVDSTFIHSFVEQRTLHVDQAQHIDLYRVIHYFTSVMTVRCVLRVPRLLPHGTSALSQCRRLISGGTQRQYRYSYQHTGTYWEGTNHQRSARGIIE